MCLGQRHLLLVFVSNLLKRSFIYICLNKNGLGHNLREKEVGRTGRGIRLHIFIAGDHFADAIPVQCTFGDISVSFLLCKHSGSKRANCRDGLVWRIYIVHGPLVITVHIKYHSQL